MTCVDCSVKVAETEATLCFNCDALHCGECAADRRANDRRQCEPPCEFFCHNCFDDRDETECRDCFEPGCHWCMQSQCHMCNATDRVVPLVCDNCIDLCAICKRFTCTVHLQKCSIKVEAANGSARRKRNGIKVCVDCVSEGLYLLKDAYSELQ